jgi:hypothetical protein
VVRLLQLGIDLRNRRLHHTEGSFWDERDPSGVTLSQRELFFDLGEGHFLLPPRPGDEAAAQSATERLRDNMARLIALSSHAKAKVVVVGYLHAPDVNALLREIAAANRVRFAPTWDPSGEPTEPPARFFQADGFHPTADGHARMAVSIADAIEAELTP